MTSDENIIESIAPKKGAKIESTKVNPKDKEPHVTIVGAPDLKEKGVEIVTQHPAK